MKTSIRPGKTLSTKELKVIAHFSNGFAEDTYELSDGTLIYISYHSDRVRIVERELMTDPAAEVPAIVNASQEDEAEQ